MSSLSAISNDDLLALAQQHGIQTNALPADAIADAIHMQESGGKSSSVTSVDGAKGGWQITPGTFKQFAKPGEDITKAADNEAVGRRIISTYAKKYNNDPARVATAYFSGPGNVAPADSETPFKADHSDGNGKTVSSYVSDVLGRIGSAIVPSAEAATTKQPSLSDLSDADLLALAQKHNVSIPAAGPEKPAPADIGQTVLDQGMQGATFGLAGRAEAGLAAPVLSMLNGKSLGENYKAGVDYKMSQLAQEAKDNPGTSIVAGLAGGLATGGLAAKGIATALPAVAGLATSGNAAMKVAKATAIGAGTGAVYGAGSSNYGEAGKGALEGAAIGGAFPLAGGAIGASSLAVKDTTVNVLKGMLAKSPEQLQDIASQLKSQAGNLYTQMRANGATLNTAATGGLVNDIDAALAKNKFIPNLNPKTVAIVDDLKTAAQNGQLGLDDLDQYRRLLNRVGGSEDGFSAGTVKGAIDNAVKGLAQKDLASGSTNAVQLLTQGRMQYSQASKFEDVADILNKAAGDPARIKAGLTRFLNNSDNIRGWSQPEIEALKSAASSNTIEKLLKMGGKFGLDLGTSLTPGNTVAPVIGALAGGGAVPVAGTAARLGQKYAARGKAQKLMNVLGKP